MPPPDRIDLPRGALELLVLKTLSRGPAHGYAIVQAIRATSRDALSVEEGSLYPALHRMEKQGWLAAAWETTPSGRDAKVYRLSRTGRAELAQRTRRWKSMTAAVGRILGANAAGARP